MTTKISEWEWKTYASPMAYARFTQRPSGFQGLTKSTRDKFIISEPVHVGGQNCAPTPLELLLAGAVGCYAAVFAFYAANLGVDYERFEAVARSEFDERGHMIADAPSSAFRKVTMLIDVVSDAPAEKLAEVERLALAGCPGISTLREPVPVATKLTVTRSSARAA